MIPDHLEEKHSYDDYHHDGGDLHTVPPNHSPLSYGSPHVKGGGSEARRGALAIPGAPAARIIANSSS